MHADRVSFLKELSALESRFAAMPPELELTVRGEGFEGFVVVHNTVASIGGPLGRCGKGGTRITPTVSLDEVRMLAQIMTLKNAAAGIPLGGAKSGMRADPAAPGFEQLYRQFVSMVKPILRENGGIFGGFGFDIGGRPEHALWACDELDSLTCFTGKPLNMGGTDYDREGIAGYGVAIAARQALIEHGSRTEGATFAVQGIGAMGAAIIRYFGCEMGGVLRSVADPRLGGSFDLTPEQGARFSRILTDNGVDAAIAYLSAEKIPAQSLDHVLTSAVQVLFPAAVQSVIMGDGAVVRARYVVEGANNPTSVEARTALHSRGVVVIPDFIANPGGILAAFIELSSKASLEENVAKRAKVLESKRLTEDKISENVSEVLRLSKSVDIEPVQAGRFIALRRVIS